MNQTRTQIAALVVAALLTASPAEARADWRSKPVWQRVMPGIALVLAGGALIGTGAGLQSAADAKYVELKAYCGQIPAGCEKPVYEKYQGWDRASEPLEITGGVVAAAGVAWLIVEILRAEPPPPKDDGGKDKGASPDPRDPEDNALVFTPILGPSYAGLGVAGRF